MNESLKIGIIGLDSSRCLTFARLLNDPSNAGHLKGATITVAYPGGSPDFEFCYSRMGGFVSEMREKHGAELVESPQEVAERSDAVMILSADGRVHLEQFRLIAPYGKPVFIDKPLTVSLQEAERLAELAARNNIPLMSSSALRYTGSLLAAIDDNGLGDIVGADCYGPIVLEPTQPGLFWYGIHAVEVLYAIMGRGCEEVRAETNEAHDVITCKWRDGRIATLRGNRTGNHQFGALVHRERGTQFVDISASSRGYYAAQLEAILHMFAAGKSPERMDVTLDVIRFITAANESREHGRFTAC